MTALFLYTRQNPHVVRGGDQCGFCHRKEFMNAGIVTYLTTLYSKNPDKNPDNALKWPFYAMQKNHPGFSNAGIYWHL